MTTYYFETDKITNLKRKGVSKEHRPNPIIQMGLFIALYGYYVLVTSEYKESDDRIIDIYRGLWRIEESFKVTKSDLEARPVFVSLKEHIEAHFLICFVALTIERILELKTGHMYSIARLLESLKKSVCTHVKENYYLFSYYDEVLKTIGEKTGVELNRIIC